MFPHHVEQLVRGAGQEVASYFGIFIVSDKIIFRMCAETETDNIAGHVYQLMGYDSDTKKVRDICGHYFCRYFSFFLFSPSRLHLIATLLESKIFL